MTTHKEACITIGGVELNIAQSAAIRVAVASWLMELHDDPAAMARLGSIGPIYKENLIEVQNLIMMGVR